MPRRQQKALSFFVLPAPYSSPALVKPSRANPGRLYRPAANPPRGKPRRRKTPVGSVKPGRSYQGGSKRPCLSLFCPPHTAALPWLNPAGLTPAGCTGLRQTRPAVSPVGAKRQLAVLNPADHTKSAAMKPGGAGLWQPVCRKPGTAKPARVQKTSRRFCSVRPKLLRRKKAACFSGVFIRQ